MTQRKEEFAVLTKYIGHITAVDDNGMRRVEHGNVANDLFSEFFRDFQQFVKAKYPERCAKFDFFDYRPSLRRVDLNEGRIQNGDVDDLDALGVMAIIERELTSGARWNYDPVDSFKDPKFIYWLKRLKDIDQQDDAIGAT